MPLHFLLRAYRICPGMLNIYCISTITHMCGRNVSQSVEKYIYRTKEKPPGWAASCQLNAPSLVEVNLIADLNHVKII